MWSLGWFCTGDYGCIQNDGLIVIFGKISHTVFINERYFYENSFRIPLLIKYRGILSNVVTLRETGIFNTPKQKPITIYVWTKPGEEKNVKLITWYYAGQLTLSHFTTFVYRR